MATPSLTSAAVQTAMDEFDRIGRAAFLARYGFSPTGRYFAVRAGKRYDLKALVGAAGEMASPTSHPLQPVDFNGGRSLQRRLQSLGFKTEVEPA